MNEKIIVLVRLILFEGKNMRKHPFNSGYRPIFEFSGAKTKVSARIDLINSEKFYPGEAGMVKVTFIREVIEDSFFKITQQFFISEGGKYNLGKGEIVEVISSLSSGFQPGL